MALHPKVEDVPVPERFVCSRCGEIQERSRISALEVLLGGWVRGACSNSESAVVTWTPWKGSWGADDTTQR